MSIRIQSGAVLSTAILGFVASSALLVSTTAWGQGIPGQSVNIIGPTPDVDYMFPDKGHWGNHFVLTSSPLIKFVP